MNRLTDFVLCYPWRIFFFFALLVIGAQAVHQERRRYDFSFETMAPKNTPEFEVFKEFIDLFGESEDIYFIAFRDDPLFTTENLRLIERVTKRLEELRETESVISLTNVLDIRGSERLLEIVEFIDPIPEERVELERLRMEMASDPFLVQNLISEDGKTAAFIGRLKTWAADPNVHVAYFDKVDTILSEEGGGHIKFHIAGLPFLNRTYMRHMDHDLGIFIPLIIGLMCILLWLAFRRGRAVWIPIVTIAFAAILTMGTLSLFGVPMSLLTGEATLPVLIMVIGVSDAVHLLNRYEEDISAAPDLPKPAALRRTISHIGMACLLTSVTTAIGLLSLLTSEIPTIRWFGIFGASGIIYAYLVTILFLTAALHLVDRWKPAVARPQRRSDPLDRALGATAAFVSRRRIPLIVAGIIVLLSSAVAIRWIEINNRATRDLKRDDPAVRSIDFMEENLGAAFQTEVLVKGGAADAIKDPALLGAIDDLRAGLESIPHVAKVMTPVEFIKKMNREMHDGDASAYSIPPSREAVAQYLLLYEQGGSDAEFNRLVTYDYSIARLMVRVKENRSRKDHREIEKRIKEIAASRFGEGVRVYESGDAPLFYTVTERLVSSLIRSLYLAMPVIFLVIAVTFRSLRLALLSALPNLIPITIALGLMAVSGIDLKFSTIIAFPIAFGIAVDDTIHFLARYRVEIHAGASPEEAVRRTLRTAGRAMLLTTVFLVTGYSVLLVSNFLATVHIAILTGVILTVALLADLLVLPALLLTFRPKV